MAQIISGSGVKSKSAAAKDGSYNAAPPLKFKQRNTAAWA
jgi:hypothetical protein